MKNINISLHKISEKRYQKELKGGGFRCLKCSFWVPVNEFMGTQNRNHCISCLWSKHVDLHRSGDRLSECHGGMSPIGLTLKHQGYFKMGELMLIHHCCSCGKISINRIAADDIEDTILKIFQLSHELFTEWREPLSRQNITMLEEQDIDIVQTQLFGKRSF